MDGFSDLLTVAASRFTPQKYAIVLTQAAVPIAAVAIISSFIFDDTTLLGYTLLNWIAVTSWLAYLTHSKRWSSWLTWRTAALTLQWFAAAAVLPCLWRFAVDWGISPQAPVFAAAAWPLLAVSLFVRRGHWFYRRPWQTASHAAAFWMLSRAPYDGFEPFELISLVVVALFYFTAAWLYKNRWWLILAGLLLPYAITIYFNQHIIDPHYLMITIAFIPLIYFGGAYYLKTYRAIPQKFFAPLCWTAHIAITIPLLLISGASAILVPYDLLDTDIPKMALSILVITAAYIIYAWLTNYQVWAQTAVWLSIFTAGLFMIAYTPTNGFPAFLIALLTCVYLLIEHLLSIRARRRLHPKTNPYGKAIRRAWRLFRWPLHLAGWALSGAAILLAIVHNMFILEAPYPNTSGRF